MGTSPRQLTCMSVRCTLQQESKLSQRQEWNIWPMMTKEKQEVQYVLRSVLEVQVFCLTLKCPRGLNGPPIVFSDLKTEAWKLN